MHHACPRLTDRDATKSTSALPASLGKESKTRGCYMFVRVDVGHLIPGQQPPIATLTAVLIIPCVFAQCSFPERYPCQVLPTCIARSPVSARPTETIISARRSQQSGLSPRAMIAVRTDSPFIDGRSQDKIGIFLSYAMVRAQISSPSTPLKFYRYLSTYRPWRIRNHCRLHRLKAAQTT